MEACCLDIPAQAHKHVGLGVRSESSACVRAGTRVIDALCLDLSITSGMQIHSQGDSRFDGVGGKNVEDSWSLGWPSLQNTPPTQSTAFVGSPTPSAINTQD